MGSVTRCREKGIHSGADCVARERKLQQPSVAKVTGQSVGLPVAIRDSVANFGVRRKVPRANE
jgi:hypothetical protein